jgi:hypothetical protein
MRKFLRLKCKTLKTTGTKNIKIKALGTKINLYENSKEQIELFATSQN